MLSLGQRVLEVVGVFAFGDDDVHAAGEAGELVGSGVGDDGDGQFAVAAYHRAAVLEIEPAVTTAQRARHFFNRDVTSRTLHTAAARHQHLPVARRLQLAVK